MEDDVFLQAAAADLSDLDPTISKERAAALAAYPFITAEELHARPHQPLRYLIRGQVPANESILISGKERSFKSFIVMEWAIALALGEPCLGMFDVAQPATVVLFDLENNPDRVDDRMANALARYGKTFADFEGRFLLFDRRHAPTRFEFTPEGLALMRTVIERERPALVIIDNLRKASGGKDEKKSEDMLPIFNAMLDAVEAVGATLVIVHHNRRDDTGFSGSGAIISTLANAIIVKRNRQSGVAVIKCESMRNAELFDAYAVTMGHDGALRITDMPDDEEDEAESREDYGARVIDSVRTGAKTQLEIMEDSGMTKWQVRPHIKRLVNSGVLFERRRVGDGGRGASPLEYGLIARG